MSLIREDEMATWKIGRPGVEMAVRGDDKGSCLYKFGFLQKNNERNG